MNEHKNVSLMVAETLAKQLGLKTIYGKVCVKEGNCYVPYNYRLLKKLIVSNFYSAGEEARLGRYNVEDTIYILKTITAVPEEVINPSNYFCAQNGILKINDAGKVELFENENMIFTSIGDVPFLPDADTSAAKTFLSMVIPNEKERNLLLESCAVGMFPFIRYLVNFDHFNICFGSGSNGKTIFFESILTPIFGEEFVANITVEELKNRFNLHELVGRRINVATENDETYLSEHKQLKALTSGDRQQIEKKFEQPYFARIFIVPFFCVNQQPQIGNVSHAMKRRLIVINFPNQFSSDAEDLRFRADPELKDPRCNKCKIIQAGMMKLIVNTVERLLVDKALTHTDLSYIEELQKESSHLRLFVDECFVFDKASFIPSHKLFESYQKYCIIKGYYQEKWGRWVDPGKYDPAMKHAASLTGKLLRLFPDQLSHYKEKGDRGIKGLREKSKGEKMASIGQESVLPIIKEGNNE